MKANGTLGPGLYQRVFIAKGMCDISSGNSKTVPDQNPSTTRKPSLYLNTKKAFKK